MRSVCNQQWRELLGDRRMDNKPLEGDKLAVLAIDVFPAYRSIRRYLIHNWQGTWILRFQMLTARFDIAFSFSLI